MHMRHLRLATALLLAALAGLSHPCLGADKGALLAKAINANDVAAVQRLLEQGADPNLKSRGDRPLMLAVRGMADRPGITALLLDHHAEVDARDSKGNTALMMAANQGHAASVRLLLAHGADVNARGQKHGTSLMFAAAHFAPQVVKLLIEAGADVNAKSDDGETALDCAMFDPVTTDLLLKAGAK